MLGESHLTSDESRKEKTKVADDRRQAIDTEVARLWHLANDGDEEVTPGERR